MSLLQCLSWTWRVYEGMDGLPEMCCGMGRFVAAVGLFSCPGAAVSPGEEQSWVCLGSLSQPSALPTAPSPVGIAPACRGSASWEFPSPVPEYLHPKSDSADDLPSSYLTPPPHP